MAAVGGQLAHPVDRTAKLLGVVVLVPQILPVDRALGHVALYRAGAAP
jgi:hypothetical protein